jgi:hypothetical protein
MVTQCVVSYLLSSNALKSLIIASGRFPSQHLWGPMDSGFAYDCDLRGAARSPLEGITLEVAVLFTQC